MILSFLLFDDIFLDGLVIASVCKPSISLFPFISPYIYSLHQREMTPQAHPPKSSNDDKNMESDTSETTSPPPTFYRSPAQSSYSTTPANHSHPRATAVRRRRVAREGWKGVGYRVFWMEDYGWRRDVAHEGHKRQV